jgi:hypothetical protein
LIILSVVAFRAGQGPAKIQRAAKLIETPYCQTQPTYKRPIDEILELVRWTLRRWNQLPAVQSSVLSYGLNYGGHVGDGQVVFSVQLNSLLEALDALRQQPKREEE